MSAKTRLALAGAIFLVGAGVGSCTATEQASDATDDTVTTEPAPVKTETVTEYKERKVGEVPESCMNVLDSISGIKSSEDDLMNVFIRGSDIMSDGHEALASSDGSSLNEAREKLYKLDTDSNKSAQSLSLRLWPDLQRYLGACKQTDAYKGGK